MGSAGSHSSLGENEQCQDNETKPKMEIRKVINVAIPYLQICDMIRHIHLHLQGTDGVRRLVSDQ